MEHTTVQSPLAAQTASRLTAELEKNVNEELEVCH